MGIFKTVGFVKTAVITSALLASLVGCQNKLHDENKALWDQNRELQAKYQALSTAPKADPAQVAQLQNELAQRDATIADLQNQLRQPSADDGNNPGLAGIETSFDKTTGNMTVNIPGDVLFDAGQATLKDSARATLNKIVAAIRRDYAGKHVFVDGYSDADPISKSKSLWQDNLDLSAARARAVSQYLISQGLSSGNVDPRAFGATKSKKTKEASRRVEIVVSTR